MANRRMLSKSISYSKQVNSIDEFTQLLFTWGIPHLDDYGRINGDAKIFKAIVMPMSERPVEEFEASLQKLFACRLIDRYEVEDELVIHYLGFERHQTGLNKRTKSKFPENPKNSENIQENLQTSFSTEHNQIEINQTEINANEANETIADDNTDNEETNPYPSINPHSYIPSNEVEYAALEAWSNIDSDNPDSFGFYIWAMKNELPVQKFFEFTSEIKDDPTIRNKGAVFNKKVKDYFKNLRS